MQRITKKADLILVSDVHLRLDTPICRTDDFPAAQWAKMDFIKNVQVEHGCPVLCAGDLFHHWKPSPFLLSETIKHLPDQFYTAYGNHDLPQHSLELKDKCGIYTLAQANVLSTTGKHNVTICNWKESPPDVEALTVRRILVWHVFTYQGTEPWPGCTDPKASRLLKKYPQFDLIVTGDNHQPFVEEFEGRILVNPGSMSRQKANETHRPQIYLWYSDTNTVKAVYLPCDEKAITSEHLEKQEQRENRLNAFISRVNTDWKATMSFEDNLQLFEKENNIHEKTMAIVYKSLETQKI